MKIKENCCLSENVFFYENGRLRPYYKLIHLTAKTERYLIEFASQMLYSNCKL